MNKSPVKFSKQFFIALCLASLLIQPLQIAEAVSDRQSKTKQAQPTKPNYLFIAIDDLNDWVGCMNGHQQVQTPAIDGLAGRGTLFTNAHCQAPLCNPSRTSLLTGLRPTTTGVYALQPWFRRVESLKNLVTLPQYLAQHGYRTITAGKIFHDGSPPVAERKNEFNVWDQVDNYKNLPAQKFVTTPENHRLVDWGMFPETDSDHDDWKLADWAIEKLRSAPSQPFFLAVGFRLPHVPLYTPERWFDLYPDDKLIMPAVKADDRNDTPEFSWYLHWKLPEPRLSWLQSANQWRPMVRAYLASVSFVDNQVGRVLEALEKNGLAENTVVVLWSDHGWHLGEKAISGKNSLWERSTRVPLVFAGPGISVGARSNRPVELLDLYPTLADLSGLPVSKELEGHSLKPLLKNAKASRPWPAITTHNPDNHTVRSERWRYIRYADGSEELYDMRRDPNEWNNLAGNPRFARIIAEHRKWLPKTNAKPTAPNGARSLVNEDGVWKWEGNPIRKEDKQP